MSQPRSSEVNQARMDASLGKVVADLGASLSSILACVGLRSGRCRALADTDGMTSAAAKKGRLIGFFRLV